MNRSSKENENKSFYRTSVILDKEIYKALNKIATHKCESLASVIREDIKKGLDAE